MPLSFEWDQDNDRVSGPGFGVVQDQRKRRNPAGLRIFFYKYIMIINSNKRASGVDIGVARQLHYCAFEPQRCIIPADNDFNVRF